MAAGGTVQALFHTVPAAQKASHSKALHCLPLLPAADWYGPHLSTLSPARDLVQGQVVKQHQVLLVQQPVAPALQSGWLQAGRQA